MKNKKQLISENPFYGKQNLFALYQNGTKTIAPYLTKAWQECSSKEDRQLFHTICFGVGDITNRQHNIFGKDKVDDGGNSANVQWLEYLNWLFTNNKQQFIKFLPLMVEYVGLRELTTFQIKTTKYKKNISGSFGLLKLIQSDTLVYSALLDLLVNYIKGNNPFYKTQVAKFVHIPRYSKRQKTTKEGKKDGLRDLQSQTKEKMKVYQKLVTDLSGKMNWLVEVKDKYTSFTGYRNWQKQYNGDLEFVLFSTNKINEFDQEQFTNWLNTLPSGARYRVRRRLFDGNDVEKTKWAKLATWFKSWEKFKEDKQKEQRVLQEKAKTVGLSDEEKIRLAKVSKEAKVTTGGSTLYSELESIINGNQSQITLESIFNKMNFDVKVRVVADYSGSMNGRPKLVASLLATAALLKSDSDYDLLIGFSSDYKIWSSGSSVSAAQNKFLKGSQTKVEKFIDKTASFYENFQRVYAAYQSGTASATYIDQVSKAFKDWVNSTSDAVEKQARIEDILSCPVLMLISDGDLNNSGSPQASLNKFKMDLKQWFGYEPLIVIWDIPRTGDGNNTSSKFEGVENVIHITTYNLSVVNQIFTKLNDLDVIDIYTPLKSLFLSNRYDLVKSKTI